jgi:ParB-like chromosome segregation protein Spo0J
MIKATILICDIVVIVTPRDRSDLELDFLIKDIAKNGLQLPIVVCPLENQTNKYSLRGGFRRLMACMVLGHTKISALIMEPKDHLFGHYFYNQL